MRGGVLNFRRSDLVIIRSEWVSVLVNDHLRNSSTCVLGVVDVRFSEALEAKSHHLQLIAIGK